MKKNNDFINETDIEEALKHFEEILKEQLKRCSKMRNSCETGKQNAGDDKGEITVGLIGGDGIGPVIMEETTKILNKLLSDEIADERIELKEISGLTLENRIAKGETVPDDVLKEMKKCDVILKGPTTTPSGGEKNLESANVFLRREFDLFANVRPVKIETEDIDWTFFRENTEGEYTLGSKGVRIGDKFSVDFKITTYEGTRRIAKAAFDFAKKNNKKRVTIVTKANIMKKTDGDFLKICKDVASGYPDIEVDSRFVDIMAANLINKEERKKFEVILLPNLYGDIITDEAAEIQGGVGTAGSANIGSTYAIFEAIHGSAPRMVMEGLSEKANPASLLKAASMMLEHIGYDEKSKRLEKAINKTDLLIGHRMSGQREGASCSEYANLVMKNI